MATKGMLRFYESNKGSVCERSVCKRIICSLRWGAALVMVLVASAAMLAIMPASANLIAEPASSAALDPPSGCPCSGGCGTPSESQDTQAQAGANVIGQPVQPVNIPASVPQPVDNVPAAVVPAAVADEPVSMAPESAKNNGIAGLMESFSLAGLKELMPSQLTDNDETSSGTPYNSFWNKMNIQSASADPVFAGWQQSPVSGMVSWPLQFSFEK